MKICIGTMVKNEEDIILEWIVYHGKLFGINNLFIIDNYSEDNTFYFCQKFIKYGLKLIRKDNYLAKGDYMTDILHYAKKLNYDIFIPLDIDEFVTLNGSP